jgi:predicted MFS family arabinose efflux permease
MIFISTIKKYHKNIKNLFFSFLISSIGTNTARIIMSVLVYQLTGSKTSTAASIIVSRLPSMILGSPIGRLSEAFDPKKIMLVLEFFSFLLFLILAFFYDDFGVWFIFFVFFLTYTNMFIFHAVKTKLITSFLNNSDLINEAMAMRLQIVYFSLAIGPYISGYLLKWLPASDVLILNSVVFLISILFLIRLPNIQNNFEIHKTLKNIFRFNNWFGISDNLKSIRKKVVLKQISFFYFVRSIAYGIVNGVVPLIALDYLKIGSEGLGTYFLCGMFGAMIGTYLYGKFVKLKIPAHGVRQSFYFVIMSIFEIVFLFLHLSSNDFLSFIAFVFIANNFMLLVESRIEYIFADLPDNNEKAAIRSFQEVIKSSGFLIGIIFLLTTINHLNYFQLSKIVALIMILSCLVLFLEKATNPKYEFKI